MLEELTLKKAVEFAIKTEELGARIYKRLAQRFAEQKELHEIFSVLSREEEAHQRQFELLLDQVPGDQVTSGVERYQYLRAMSISEFFVGGEGLYAKVDEIKTREDALHRALGLEKATLQYYEAMRDVLAQREELETIIRAEKSHVLMIMKYLITEAKVRGVPESVDASDFR